MLTVAGALWSLEIECSRPKLTNEASMLLLALFMAVTYQVLHFLLVPVLFRTQQAYLLLFVAQHAVDRLMDHAFMRCMLLAWGSCATAVVYAVLNALMFVASSLPKRSFLLLPKVLLLLQSIMEGSKLLLVSLTRINCAVAPRVKVPAGADCMLQCELYFKSLRVLGISTARLDLTIVNGYLPSLVKVKSSQFAHGQGQHTRQLQLLVKALPVHSDCLLASKLDVHWFRGPPRGASTTTNGFLAMLKSGSYEHVLDWHGRKRAAVSRSRCESEFIALGQASAELLWLRGLLMELKLLTTSTTVLSVPDTAVVKVHLDSTSAKQLAENEGYTGKTRHIGIQFYFVRDLVETGIISLTWVPSQQQLADAFTKALDEAAFVRFQRAVMFRFEVRRAS